MGSCFLNLMLNAVMDLTCWPGRVLARAREVHILSAGLEVLLLRLVAMRVLIGIYLGSIAALYLLG